MVDIGTILTAIFCFIVCYIVGLVFAFSIVEPKKKQKKKYSFDYPTNVDLKDVESFDAELLYDKDVRKSIDGSNASKEFKKG